MRAFLIGLMTLVLMLGATRAEAQHLAMRLVPESATPRAGSTIAIAIAATPERGWHGYWQNPGDAGFPARFDWTLPAGAGVSAPRYPVPERLLIGGLMNYVFSRPYALVAELTLPAGLAAGTRVPVATRIDYLVCTDTLCVPESAQLSTVVTIGDGTITPESAAMFTRWRAALPSAAVPGTFAREGDRVRIAAALPGVTGEDAYFYPFEGGAIDQAVAQTVTRDGDTLIVEAKAKGVVTPVIEGVLSVGGRGIGVRAVPGAVAAGGADRSASGAAALAFLGAVLGGVLLNVMPCVFPILSLKALHLARGGGSDRAARHEALAYAAGVILVCVALGGLLLALRAGGSAVGWAFQLQDVRVVGVLLLLVTGISLNLAGVFALPVPRFVGEAGGGAMGAFATGALAAFVATPCTGPFMGAALGAALVLPAAAGLLVFAGLGFGIALPFLLIGFVPALRRRLPKPGAWMERVQRVLSVPMFLTALALAWVLGRQAGVDGMTLALAAALLLALGLWWSGRRQASGRGLGAPAALALVAAVALVLTIRPEASEARSVAGVEPFGESRLATLRAEGRPVFAYFTADWCLTCKVNEAAAIDTDATRGAFAANRIAVLEGDWTDGDAALGRFIQQHNRAGVPLYLWYAPGAAEPEVLPQILSPGYLAARAAR